MSPPLLPDVSLVQVALAGVLNPVLMAVAFIMGRKADQAVKLVIAAFAGAIASVVTLYLAALVGVPGADNLSRAIAGVFTVSLIAGIFYAAAGYWGRKLSKP